MQQIQQCCIWILVPRPVCGVALDCKMLSPHLFYIIILFILHRSHIIAHLNKNSRMFFCRLHQPQQSALCKVVKEDVTLDSMSTVKGKVDTRSDDNMIFLFWQHLCFLVCLFALYSIIMSLSGRYLPLDINPCLLPSCGWTVLLQTLGHLLVQSHPTKPLVPQTTCADCQSFAWI